MPLDARKRQRKLERQNTRRRAEKKALARRKQMGLAARLQESSQAPVWHCLMTEEIWGSAGLGYVLISRKLPNGFVAVGVFLVDRLCLGVKDVFGTIVPAADYTQRLYKRFMNDREAIEILPSYARKLIECAVEYARELGLAPHPDFRKVYPIFGNIDASACDEEFEFGKGGMPVFVAGPSDSTERCNFVLRTLESKLGPDGFRFLMPVKPGVSHQLLNRVDDDDDDDDDVEDDDDFYLDDDEEE